MGGNTMKATGTTARHGRGRRRAFTTAFCSMLVFALGLGQAMIPAANADAPTLTMGQVQTTSGGQLAVDSLNVDLDQWANLAGQGWQNGDLNKNNSAYAEGDVVPFRLAIEGLGAGQHTIRPQLRLHGRGSRGIRLPRHVRRDGEPRAVRSGWRRGVLDVPRPPQRGHRAVQERPLRARRASRFDDQGGSDGRGAQAFAGVSRNLTMYGGTIDNLTVPTHSDRPTTRARPTSR